MLVFRYRFADKLPEWIDKFKAEGLTDAQIQDIIRGKEQKYINKWGNTSKVGILINNYSDARERSEQQLQMKPRD